MWKRSPCCQRARTFIRARDSESAWGEGSARRFFVLAFRSEDRGFIVFAPAKTGIHPVFQCSRAWTVDSPLVSRYSIMVCDYERHPVFHCPSGGGVSFSILLFGSWLFRFRQW